MADDPGLDVQIGLTTQRLAKQLADVEARMIRTAKRGEDAFKTSNGRAAASFTQVGAAADRASRKMSARFQNVGFQVQDIAVQIAGGQGVVRAFSQQLPQLAGGFGLVGVAIGTLAAVAIPLFASFLGGSEDVQTLKEKLEELTRAQQEYAASAELSSVPLVELKVKYGELADEIQRALEIRTKFDREGAVKGFDQIAQETTSPLTVGLEPGKGQQASAEVAIVIDALNRLQAIRDQMAAMTPEQAQFFNFSEDLTAIDATLGKYGELRAGLEAIASQYGVTIQQAGVLAVAAANVERAENFQGRIEAASILVGILNQVAESNATGAQEAAALADFLNEAVIAAGGVAATDIAGPIGAAADEASRLAKNLQFAAAQQRLVDASKTYGEVGARGDPRKLASTDGVSEFKYSGPALDADNNPTGGGRGGGGRGGGGGGQSEADKEAAAFEKIFEQGQREIEQLQSRLDLIGKSAEETARLTAEYELLNAAKKAGLDLDTVSAQTGLTLREQIEQQAAAIGRLTEKYALAKQQAEFFDSIQDQLQDGFIDAIVSGQDFAGVLADVAKQLAKAFLQSALFGKGPLAGIFGGTPGKGALSFLGFAEGGYTGNGTKYQPAGVVHKGEYVFDAKATRRIGVRRLEALRSGLKGYASGGLVGGGSRAAGVNVTARPVVTVAVIDNEEKFGQYLASNPRAEREVMTIVKRNGG